MEWNCHFSNTWRGCAQSIHVESQIAGHSCYRVRAVEKKAPSTSEKHIIALLVFTSIVGVYQSTNTIPALLPKDLWCHIQAVTALDLKDCDQLHNSLQRDHLQSKAPVPNSGPLQNNCKLSCVLRGNLTVIPWRQLRLLNCTADVMN